MIKTFFLAASVSLFATSATAEPKCGPRDNVVNYLTSNYSETVQAAGIAGTSVFMEFWANTETRTWTFTLTLPDGNTCMMASGTNLEMLEQAPAPQGDLN